MTDVQCSIRRARRIRAVFVLFAALNAFMLAVNVILGSALAVLPAVGIVALLALIVFATRLIGSLRRTQELNRHAEELELAAEAVKSRAGRCTHPDAEPVDLLLTGERVGWICPACNAELPAGWTPAKGTGTLTATGTMGMSPVAALSGSGTLSAKAVPIWCTCPPDACAPVGVRVYNAGFPVIRYCAACGMRIPPLPDERVPESREVSAKATWDDVAYASEAAQHFAQLARAGRESCSSPCRLCEARDRHYPTPGSRALLSAKLAGFKDDASLRNWIEKGRFS